jgi:hypothetical protein
MLYVRVLGYGNSLRELNAHEAMMYYSLREPCAHEATMYFGCHVCDCLHGPTRFFPSALRPRFLERWQPYVYLFVGSLRELNAHEAIDITYTYLYVHTWGGTINTYI